VCFPGEGLGTDALPGPHRKDALPPRDLGVLVPCLALGRFFWRFDISFRKDEKLFFSLLSRSPRWLPHSGAAEKGPLPTSEEVCV